MFLISCLALPSPSVTSCLMMMLIRVMRLVMRMMLIIMMMLITMMTLVTRMTPCPPLPL